MVHECSRDTSLSAQLHSTAPNCFRRLASNFMLIQLPWSEVFRRMFRGNCSDIRYLQRVGLKSDTAGSLQSNSTPPLRLQDIAQPLVCTSALGDEDLFV